MRKALLLISGIFFVASLLSVGIWVFVFRDEPPVDDSDLYLEFQPAPKDNNGYVLLAQIGEKTDVNSDEVKKLLDERPFDIQQARAMIKAHRDLLDQFYQVCDMSNFGRVTRDNDNRIRFSNATVNLARLESEVALNEGKGDLAAGIGVYLVELGYKFEHCNGPVIDDLIGMLVKRQGIEIINEALKLGLERSTMLDIRQRLIRTTDSRQGYIVALRIEYSEWGRKIAKPNELFQSYSTNVKSREIRGPFWFYQPHQTQRIYAEHFRDLIAYQEGKLRESPKTIENRAHWSIGNSAGITLLYVMTPNLVSDRPREIEKKIKETIQAIDRQL